MFLSLVIIIARKKPHELALFVTHLRVYFYLLLWCCNNIIVCQMGGR